MCFVSKRIHNMKHLRSLLLALMVPASLSAQTVIVDHEAPSTTTTFQYFGNCDLEGVLNNIVANPAPDAVNGSANVAEFIRRDCAASFAGYFSNPVPTNPMDLTTDNRINMKVWLPNPGSVTLKLEGSTTGCANWEQTIAVADSAQWVDIQFDADQVSAAAPFTAASGCSYATVVIFFNLGSPAPAADQLFYWDDLTTEEVVTLAKIDLPVTFDDPGTDYTLVDFGGNFTTLVPDPTDGANTVASSFRPATSDFFAGTTVGNLDLANAVPIDNDNTRLSLRVWSPVAGKPVRLKLENVGVPTQSVEAEVLTTVGGAWETLIFDMADEVPGTAALNVTYIFNKASVFFDFNSTDPIDRTYLWDDLEFIGGGGTGVVLPDLPLTFDDPAVSYSFVDFGGAATSLATDPDDAGNNIASTFRPSTAEFFAGTFMAGAAGVVTPIDLSPTNSQLSLRVWAPDTGQIVRLKIENASNPGVFVETDAVTAVAGAWATLTFDFANPNPGSPAIDTNQVYNNPIVFFDFGTTGGADQTFLWDDLIFGAPAACSSATPPTGQSHTTLSNRVQLDWTPQTGAVACQVNGQRLPTGPSPSVNILSGDISTTNVPFNAAGAGTTWTWRVRCACSVSPLDVTAFTAFGDTFSIPTPRVANVEGVEGLFPNPATDVMTVSVRSAEGQDALMVVTDLLGRERIVRTVRLEEGLNPIRLDVSGLAAGNYFVRVGEGSASAFSVR